MSSPLPSTFASAAAGNTQESAAGSRREVMNSGEWSRNRMNGATQTFRRPSVATNPSHSRENAPAAVANTSNPTSAAYIPPHLSSNYQSSRNGDSSYSKEQLLSLYKNQRGSKDWGKSISGYFMGDWNPRSERPPTNGSWGKQDDSKDYNAAGPEVCWDHKGQSEPLGLMDMNEEEKELFSTSVNSPLKPPPQNTNKDGASTGSTLGRKLSVSHGHMNAFNSTSPASTRTVPRRRGTGDSGNPLSPTSSRFFRDESNVATPPPSILRRKTDIKESAVDSKWEEKEKSFAERDPSFDISSPFGSLKRSATNPVSAGALGSNSPWSSNQGSAFGSMGVGAFGNFAMGSVAPQSATEKKPGFGSLRGESRFKNLLSKGSSEDMSGSNKDKSSAIGLDRLAETEDDMPRETTEEAFRNRPSRSETNPFVDERRSGSAALGGQEIGTSGIGGIDQFGLSSFGMPGGTSALRDLVASSQPPNHTHHEPMSPTHTNPYQSPRGDRNNDVGLGDPDNEGSDIQQHARLPNISDLRDDSGHGSFSAMSRSGIISDIPAADRSQTSSVGANRGFPSLGGLGGLGSLGNSGGWPTSSATGTPTRERPAFGFGDPIFGPMSDLQSPGASGLGGAGIFGSQTSLSNMGATSRPSKLGSLFPPAMQDQMRNEQSHSNEEPGKPQDPFMSHDKSSAMLTHPTSTTSHTPVGTSGGGAVTNPSAQSLLDGNMPQSQNAGQFGGSSSSQLPPAQQRQMVMPDRMRWIYRDPQGNTQGPWSGLEMHDWFKAGFFTAELQVKKLEDVEYEPLAQLVRRIGNSREPFLVPQIGVPHGAPMSQPGPWGAAPPSQAGAVQPPFASSFPSFGTTLTAEQQNALERRKQEEQYLMARQKEHLAQQQALMKMQQIQGPAHPINPQQLQHHSSAHSLQSQPSFGSITSPAAFQPTPMQGPIQPPHSVPAFFEGPMRQNTGPPGSQAGAPEFGVGHDEMPILMDRINVNRGAGQFGFNNAGSFPPGHQENQAHNQAVSTMLQDRSRLQQEQENFTKAHPESIFDQQARDERVRQFHALRIADEDIPVRRTEEPSSHREANQEQRSQEESPVPNDQNHFNQGDEQELTLTQKVQNAASAQRLHQQQQQQQQFNIQAPPAEVESPWAKIDNGLPQPFPPPPSQSPLPAPAAQRNRQHVADNLAAETRSETQTPNEVHATSVAPWAKEHSEAAKGPSLREIQEAEARKAAKLEELAAATRRAIAEQERANPPPAPAPGLPSTANWARSGSASTPTTDAASAWSKSVGGKNQATPTTTAPKKTLAQIQKEEEARKQRTAAAAAAAASAANSLGTAAGKRYAELASKMTAQQPASPAAASGAWTTVGASGKAKALPVTTAVNSRNVPGLTPSPTPATKPKSIMSRTVSIGNSAAASANRPAEELAKWAKLALEKGLNSSINVDDFVQQLLFLPPESEIISDSVYANSQTLDGRRFAEEFIRRRKLADKGIVDPASSGAGAFGSPAESKNASDGWNEVAKKGNAAASREDTTASNAAFKVVSKKKGKR
ncbi:GYF domain-containing protein [Arthroderma uncinatum]|uniref:GYF domain-containing protein n=1 Tax=Arthroderma uncinatum TaxID=74035 RepID=UPI00144AA13F|nr:GYF domain-containing protein [Arthroderma uncinatum]KAF3482826.1 GYF domain-containing protein [Arthroderma uncinatum]